MDNKKNDIPTTIDIDNKENIAFVGQGEGKIIDKKDKKILYTGFLGNCIGMVIYDDQKKGLIHLDTDTITEENINKIKHNFKKNAIIEFYGGSKENIKILQNIIGIGEIKIQKNIFEQSELIFENEEKIIFQKQQKNSNFSNYNFETLMNIKDTHKIELIDLLK